MVKTYTLNELDKVEILTLQDNFIDIIATDNSDMVLRANSLQDGVLKKSVLAEHGYAAIVRTTRADATRTLLFDFGFSEGGAAMNARALNVDMKEVEQMALSHGHMDHIGGFRELAEMTGKKGIELVVHPGVFRYPRYLKFSETTKAYFPRFTRELVREAGVTLVESKEPFPLLGGNALFLGEIERKTDFEKGFPIAFFEESGYEKWDPIEDDTTIAMNMRGKGLVVLSGCAHSGIINSINYAKKVTGIDRVYAVIGGFHLCGPLFEPIIGKTTEELKKINPSFLIPCHCTGRNAVRHIEQEMPAQFIFNMSGTKITFST